MTATMKNNENKSSEIMKSNPADGKAVHSFSSKRKSKETRDFDLNEPFIHTTPESSPSRIRIDILPNTQVPVQTPLDFPSPAEEHATKDSERVHSSNDAKKMKLTIDLNAEIGDETPISCSEVAREIRSVRSIDLEAIPEDFPPSASSNKIDNADETTEGPQENADTAEDDRVGSEARKRKNCEEDNKVKILTRSIRELRPRVVVQIESEVMILDDGYRWRKYGQKVIKGNLNPRSYYKCTSAGCPVRKHVERDSRNLKYVITSYEGKHNHEAPPTGSRNKSQMHPDGGNPAALPSAQPPTLAPHYHTNPVFNNELLRHGFGSFNSYMNFGSSSSPQMHYSFLNNNNNPIPYSSSGLNLDRYATPQMFLESFNAPSFGHNFNSGSSSALSFRITGERYWVPPRP